MGLNDINTYQYHWLELSDTHMCIVRCSSALPILGIIGIYHLSLHSLYLSPIPPLLLLFITPPSTPCIYHPSSTPRIYQPSSTRRIYHPSSSPLHPESCIFCCFLCFIKLLVNYRFQVHGLSLCFWLFLCSGFLQWAAASVPRGGPGWVQSN